MHLAQHAILTLAGLAYLAGPVAMADAQTVYEGRSRGVVVHLPTLGVPDITLVDTGEPPPTGGMLAEYLIHAVVMNIGDPVVTTTVVGDTTEGGGNTTNSTSVIDDLVVLPGHPAELTATTVRSDAHAECMAVAGSRLIPVPCRSATTGPVGRGGVGGVGGRGPDGRRELRPGPHPGRKEPRPPSRSPRGTLPRIE